MTSGIDEIDHVFLLCLENRSFDHMLGARPNVAGVSAAHSNLDLRGESHAQTPLEAPRSNVFIYDPPHDSTSVAKQFEGSMGGFVKEFERAHPGVVPAELGPGDVMKYLDVGSMPVSDYLADHFTISDSWFSAIPTQTMPNRMYAMCGHSCGYRDNPTTTLEYVVGFPNDDSIFHKLSKKGLDWRVYSDNVAPLVALIASLRIPLLSNARHRSLTRLADDLKNANKHFPSLVWLEPTYTWAETLVLDPFFPEPNDDHPPSDLRRGQALIQYVYNAIRGSAIWPRSALIVFYDEHGGFYDHVTPPACVPQDDGFTQRGARVPAFIVSPHVASGAVARPCDPAQVFDHCSILKMLCERHQIDYWTDRMRDPTTASLSEVFAKDAAGASDRDLDLVKLPAQAMQKKSIATAAKAPGPMALGMRELHAALRTLEAANNGARSKD